MDNKQFNAKIKPLNIEYMRLFGYIPCITDYSCTRERYIEELEKAIEEGREIFNYLEKVFVPRNVEV